MLEKIEDPVPTENNPLSKKGKKSKMKKREKFMILMLIVMTVVTVSIGYLFFHFYGKMVSALEEVKSTQITQHADHVETRQFLLSTIDWETKRQKCVLFMRDMIVDEWKRCGMERDYNQAYMIAEKNMKESEKYPHIDPLFILALQFRESSFRDTVKSSAGAIGLMQIMPATGRLLAGFFQVNFSDKILKNPNTNIMFGTKLLDVLFAQYGDFKLVLADYNGGPRQAYYYRTNDERFAKETEEYIPVIMDKWEEYKTIFQTYRIDEKMVVE
jgi:hypothetical protein